MQAEDTLIIGAGRAGLATSAGLRCEGLPHRVLERETSAMPSLKRAAIAARFCL
jgi:2-polyprenyl-6-methoxyphenol hydroxylase-like FAD-dependent oxidoreductase